MVQERQADVPTPSLTANILLSGVQPRHLLPIPIVRLPPLPAKAFYHKDDDQIHGSLSRGRPRYDHRGALTPLVDSEIRQEQLETLMGSTIVRQQSPPRPILYDAFGDPINSTGSSSNTTKSSSDITAETIVPDRDSHDQQKSGISTSPATTPEIPTAFVSSETTALLMEGARANWENICKALLVGVSQDDREILNQIMMLVSRLGTGLGPLSFAHQPPFAEREVTTAADVGSVTLCSKGTVDEAIGVMIKGAATQEAKKKEGVGLENKEELLARRERIANSLLMRRREQPITK
ncbi:MAG: hypothetical protein Q9178_000545 [Gyalolechia marmorata]